MICKAKRKPPPDKPPDITDKYIESLSKSETTQKHIDNKAFDINDIISIAKQNKDGKCSSNVSSKKMKIHGNTNTWKKIEDILHSKNKLVVVHGNTGCGKTTGIHILCKTLNLNVIEIDGSSDFTNFKQELKIAASRQSIGGKSIIVLEDINGWTPDNISTLVEVAKSKLRECCVIICTADDLYCPSLRNLRDHVISFKINTPIFEDICEIVKYHVPGISNNSIKHKIDCSRNDLRQIIMKCKGISSENITVNTPNIFKACENVLYSDLQSAITSFYSHDEFIISSMIFNNYIDAACHWTGPFSDISDLEVISQASDVFSITDMFKSNYSYINEAVYMLCSLPNKVKTYKHPSTKFNLIPIVKKNGFDADMISSLQDLT